MKQIIYAIVVLGFLRGGPKVFAQSILEKSAEQLGISAHMPEGYIESVNTTLIYPVKITEENPVPSIAQQYGKEPVQGDTFFNVFFGMVTSIIENKDNGCVVLLYIPPGKGGSDYGLIASDSTMLNIFKHISFERIKSNFSYGSSFHAPSELEAIELFSMLTIYPAEKARKMFNADAMLSYPLNFRGNVFNERFTRGRAVVAGKERHEVYLYFMMTEKSVLNFDNYLNDFEKSFWFED